MLTGFFKTHLDIDDIEDGDIPAVIDLWHNCGWTRPWNESVREIATARSCPTSRIFIGRANGMVVGVLVAGFDGHEGRLHRLAVDPCLRRNGVGGALVKHAEGWLGAQGATDVHLDLDRDNEAAVAFCLSLGYHTQRRLMPLSKQLEPG